MRLNFIATILAPLGLLWLTGCAVNEATAARVSDMDLKAIKTIYVVEHADDTHKVAEVIKKNLTNRGYQVSVGKGMSPPYPADAAVTYIDKWMWDLSMYMIELNITFRNPTTDFPALSGNSLHTSLSRKAPEAMVQEVLDNIFKTK
jgi:integrase